MDSITIFDIDAFGLSRTSPMCVAESKSIKVYNDLFIQLYLPYSVRLREQTTIKFSVFNYGNRQRDVEIMLRHSDDLCSKFRSEDFNYLQSMRVNAHSASASTFAILPLRIPKDNGKATIEIKITGEEYVRKQLLIEEPGLHNESSATILLTTNIDDPHAVVQAKDIIFDIPANSVLQHTKKCWVNVYAHSMGPNIEIDEFEERFANMDSFIRAPGATGEANMIYVAPSIYAYQYRFAVLGDEVTQGQKQQAIKHIKAAYTFELRYLTTAADKKAFAVFRGFQPSTWLNAFVTKVFSAGSILSPTMDTVPICNALEWILKQQNNDGSFKTNRAVIHREMIGDVTEPISLAAYVSITLQECVVTCPTMSFQLVEGARKAVNYLKAHKMQATGTPYVLAMGAYALYIADPLSREARDWNQLLHDSKEKVGEYIFWRGTRGKSSTIETTAYALLAEVHLNGITEDNDELTRSVAHWLISKRNSLGGFSATQDTVVALQALTYYMTVLETASKAPPQTDIQVTLIAKSEDSKWFDTPLVINMGVEDTMRRKQYEVPQPAIADGLKVRVSDTLHTILQFA